MKNECIAKIHLLGVHHNTLICLAAECLYCDKILCFNSFSRVYIVPWAKTMVSSSKEFKEESPDHASPRQTTGALLQRPKPVHTPTKQGNISDEPALVNDAFQRKKSAESSQKLITVVRVKHPLDHEALMPVAWMWPMTSISGTVMATPTALRVMSDFLGEGGVQNVLLSSGKSDKNDENADDPSSDKDAKGGGSGNGDHSGKRSPSNFTYFSNTDSDDTPPGDCFDFPLCNVLDLESEKRDTNAFFEASLDVLPDEHENELYDNWQISLDPNVGWNSVHSDYVQTLGTRPAMDSSQTNYLVPDWIEFTKKHALVQEKVMFDMMENIPFFINADHYCSNHSTASSKSWSSSVYDFDPDFSTATDLRSVEMKVRDFDARFHCSAASNAPYDKEMGRYETDNSSYEPTSIESLIGELTLTMSDYDQQGVPQATSHPSLFIPPTLNSVLDQSSIQAFLVPDMQQMGQDLDESACYSFAGIRSKYRFSHDTQILSPKTLHGYEQWSPSHLPLSPLTPASFQAPENVYQHSFFETTSPPTKSDEFQQHPTNFSNRMPNVDGEELNLLCRRPESFRSNISTLRNTTLAWADDPELSNILQGLSCRKTSTSLGEPCDTLGRRIFGRIENFGAENKPPMVGDANKSFSGWTEKPNGFTIQVLSNFFPSECRVYETSGLARPTENDRPAIICHGRSIVDWVQCCVSPTSTINVWFSTLDVFMDGYAKSEVVEFFQSYPGTSFGNSFAGEPALTVNNSFEVVSV